MGLQRRHELGDGVEKGMAWRPNPRPFLIFPTQPSPDPNMEKKAGPVDLDPSSSWYSRTRRSNGEGAEDGRRLRRRTLVVAAAAREKSPKGMDATA